MDTKFAIVSDGSCDLPAEEAARKRIHIVHFLVSFDGQTYQKEGVEIGLEDFYQKMVDEPGHFPRTAAPSPEDFYQAFASCAREGKPILCICISTKLSSSMQSAQIAKRMLENEYPDIPVIVQDSLCATLMQSAYVLEACHLRDAGYTLEEAADLLSGLRSTARILFTVGSLDYIQHGGRIGRMTGIAGTLLQIKPLITLQDGEIHSSGIRRGRRRSIEGVVDLLVSYLKDYSLVPSDCRILAGYGYDREEAERFRDLTKSRLLSEFGQTPDLPLCQIGATIGVHAGPYSIGFGVIQKSRL